MGVLETEDYLNDNIEGRYFKKDFGFWPFFHIFKAWRRTALFIY
jgi:hypothetical protein